MPEGVPTTRYKAPTFVNVPDGMSPADMPLIDKNDKDQNKVQQRLIANVRVFDLSKPDDINAASKVWQSIADGLAVISDHKTDYNAATGGYLQYIRWSEYEYVLPQPK